MVLVDRGDRGVVLDSFVLLLKLGRMIRNGLALCLTLLTATAFSADWPQLLGPNRNGVCSSTNLNLDWSAAPPKKLWSKRVGTGWSSPVVSNGKLILFHRDEDQEIVECLNAETGEEIWGARQPADYVDAYGFEAGPRATPTIHNAKVYTLGANGDIRCHDLKTGKELWAVSAKKSFGAEQGYFGFGSSPVVFQGRVLVNVGGTDNSSIVALDATNGKVMWKSFDDEASYSSPVIGTFDGTPQAIFFTRRNVVGIAPATGNVHWKVRLAPSIQTSVAASMPLISGNTVFATASYGAGATALRIDGTKATVQWANDSSLSSQYATGIIWGGHVYGFHGRVDTGPRPELRCIELKTGEVRWSNARIDSGAMLRVGKKLLVLTQSGQLIVANASITGPGRIQQVQVLGDKVRCHPAIADGRLFARDMRQLICLDLRK
jgi:outer membrane protein assembly factor BamB